MFTKNVLKSPSQKMKQPHVYSQRKNITTNNQPKLSYNPCFPILGRKAFEGAPEIH